MAYTNLKEKEGMSECLDFWPEVKKCKRSFQHSHTEAKRFEFLQSQTMPVFKGNKLELCTNVQTPVTLIRMAWPSYPIKGKKAKWLQPRHLITFWLLYY